MIDGHQPLFRVILSDMSQCALCAAPGGTILWQDDLCRIVLVTGDDAREFPGFCRVVWRNHVAEMSDLAVADRQHLMKVVFASESALRETMRPDKVNLASLGNVVPHLHWHVIPRWRGDSRFPGPVWGPRQCDGKVPPPPPVDILRSALLRALAQAQVEE
jgi:diadenosine tetraphosphate (Ap4A) HIT family hydrolase